MGNTFRLPSMSLPMTPENEGTRPLRPRYTAQTPRYETRPRNRYNPLNNHSGGRVFSSG